MSSTQRRRVRNQSATATIVNFFLDQPLDVVSGALELAQTLVARRRANGELDAMRLPKTAVERYVAERQQQVAAPPAPTVQSLQQQMAAPPAAPIAISHVSKSTEKTRQRAKRSDAGQPRKRAAGAVASPPVAVVPRRRTRKPVDVPLPGTTAAAPELPPQDIVDDEFAVDVLTELEG